MIDGSTISQGAVENEICNIAFFAFVQLSPTDCQRTESRFIQMLHDWCQYIEAWKPLDPVVIGSDYQYFGHRLREARSSKISTTFVPVSYSSAFINELRDQCEFNRFWRALLAGRISVLYERSLSLTSWNLNFWTNLHKLKLRNK